jgi:hypothetical protein
VIAASARVHARSAFWLLAPEPPERRLTIEAALERLDGLRDRLVNKLDRMDTDADLEPFLGASEGLDQSHWSQGPADLEAESDFEPDDHHCCPWPDEGDQTRLGIWAS